MQRRGRSNSTKKTADKSSPMGAGKTIDTNSLQSESLPESVPLDSEKGSVARSRSANNKTDDHDAEEHSLNAQLKYVCEQAECNYNEISTLRSENAYLRREVELLRSVVIRIDRKMSVMDNEITDLRARSMRDNILIHNYPYSHNEDLASTMPEIFKQTLGVDVKFVRIHRNGVRPQHSDRPVSITAKLMDGKKKDEILSAQKIKKIAKVPLPFYITPQ
ncbi:uncharacterized protein LOC134247500 [Saccostrea cucullata]|uniref:uncharacterized protein LOC134247500 n=1 Tax=Saccostrea cuccullata TaxID=36930 RepID=UPI002ECFF2E6